MKITLNRTDEQIQLVKAMGSKNRETSYEAQAVVAELMGGVLAEVINNAPTVSNLFTDMPFDEDDNPSIPLDLYHDITDEDLFSIYTTTVAGGLPSNTVMPKHSELKFTTYELDSAVDFAKKYAARSRLPTVSKAFTKLAQEVLVKRERNAANILLGSLADEGQDVSASNTLNTNNTLISEQDGRLMLHDLNRLMTRIKRINTAWNGGTPEGNSRRITDLILSPEVMQSIREIAYNPVNTRQADGTPAGDELGITASESLREAVFTAGGLPEIYGMNLMEIAELGAGSTYTNLYSDLVGGFTGSKTDLIIAIDRTLDAFIRPVQIDSESGSTFSLIPDDQYVGRQKRIGFYGGVEENYTILSTRGLLGLEI